MSKKKKKNAPHFETKDYPDRGRLGAPENRSGPNCSMQIAKANKSTKEFRCCWCDAVIQPGEYRAAVTAMIQPWITDDFRLMTAGRRAQALSLCSEECTKKMIEQVGEGKNVSIRDYFLVQTQNDSDNGFSKGWEWDYVKSLTDGHVDFMEPALALEKALKLVAKDQNILAAHKAAYFEHHGHDRSLIREIRNNRHRFSWEAPVDIKFSDMVAWAKQDGNLAKLVAEVTR